MAEEATTTPAPATGEPNNDPPKGDPPKGTPPAERTFSQADLDRIVQERVARERQKFSDYEDLKGKAAKFDEFEQAQKTELERAQERVAKAEQDAIAAQQAAQESMFRAAVVAEGAKRNVVDPDAAVALIDRAAITFGDDGTPTGVEGAFDSLLTQRPWLTGQRPSVPSADQGARGGANADQLSREALEQMTPEQTVEAYRKGQLRQVTGA
jgi:hypothetical protein